MNIAVTGFLAGYLPAYFYIFHTLVSVIIPGFSTSDSHVIQHVTNWAMPALKLNFKFTIS